MCLEDYGRASGGDDVAQALYARAEAGAVDTGNGLLPELYTEAMDAEQIWLQLDMQLGGALKRARRLMRKAGAVEQLINPDMEGALKGELLDPERLLRHLFARS